MSRTNPGDCILISSASTSGTSVQTLPACPAATRAVLVFYVDSTAATAIGDLSVIPIACVTENGIAPDQGFSGTSGIRLYNTATVELETQNAIANFKFIAFAAGYTVHCQIHYYK